MREIDQKASLVHGKPIRRDTFISGSRFEHIVQLYVFDKKLRILALDALERIEMAVRIDIAHLLGQREPRAHEIKECFHGNFTKKLINTVPNKGKN
jgi:abortive infection bacteriophage resistance protein